MVTFNTWYTALSIFIQYQDCRPLVYWEVYRFPPSTSKGTILWMICSICNTMGKTHSKVFASNYVSKFNGSANTVVVQCPVSKLSNRKRDIHVCVLGALSFLFCFFFCSNRCVFICSTCTWMFCSQSFLCCCCFLTHRRGLNPPHRVKSISMASFNQEEMDFMKTHGNDVSTSALLLSYWFSNSLKHIYRY